MTAGRPVVNADHVGCREQLRVPDSGVRFEPICLLNIRITRRSYGTFAYSAYQPGSNIPYYQNSQGAEKADANSQEKSAILHFSSARPSCQF
jgi:hypothetical protein